MYLNYSLGFIIASLVQAGIIILFERLNISSLGANLTFVQLITHILAGQLAGFTLLYIIRKIPSIKQLSTWLIGIIFGVIVWGIILPINSMLGKVNPPWTQGFSTVIASLIAFITYGVITIYTIKRYGSKEIEY